jgi:hypothetical protein
MMREDEWVEKERAAREADVAFFSEPGRTDRERGQVRELLRHLAIAFTDDELRVGEQRDDVDVYFRDARFQNVEHMREGRRRHAEVKERARRTREARGGADLEEPWPEHRPATFPEIVCEVLAALTKKKQARLVNRATLDALVYLNSGTYLYPVPERVDGVAVVEQLGWRSVAVLVPQHAVVICASATAPDFLRDHLGHVLQRVGWAFED